MTTQTKTTWRKIKLGDVAEIESGGTPSSSKPEYWDNGEICWITLPDLKNKYIFDTQRKITALGLKNSSAKLLPINSVIFSSRATIGEISITKVEASTNQGSKNFICDPKKIEYEFLYYLLKSKVDEIIGLATGATYKEINKTVFSGVEVEIPNIPTQKQIAYVLSAYDDLIENNTKRIKILGQIAQAIYKEWFVKPVSGGELPSGWEISILGEHLIGLESGSRPKGGVGEVREGVPSVGAENINGIGRHDHNSEKYIAKEFCEKMKRGVVQDRDVALYKDGAYIGRTSYFRDGFPHKNFAVNEHVFLLRSSGERITQNFLYLWLQEPDIIHEIRATNANAAQPGINQPGVRGLKIVLPPQKIVKTFDAKVEPILASVINLAKQNNELRQARDLLLPKLVTGEINV
ncbi:MAG: restriction endonuclease subunit S [Bacteroidota bacterium]